VAVGLVMLIVMMKSQVFNSNRWVATGSVDTDKLPSPTSDEEGSWNLILRIYMVGLPTIVVIVATLYFLLPYYF